MKSAVHFIQINLLAKISKRALLQNLNQVVLYNSINSNLQRI